MARKQTELDHPDIKKKRNQEIEEAAATYRKAVLERVAYQKLEIEAKAELMAIVAKQFEAGSLKFPDGTADGEVVTVYSFDDDEGQKLELKYGTKNQVRVRAAKGGDDETEMME